MSDTPILPEDDDALAAELALGLLAGDARRAAEARVAGDPLFAEAVARWEAHFAGIAEAEVDEVAPPGRVRRKVLAEVAPAPRRRWALPFGLGGLVAAGLVAFVLLQPAAFEPDFAVDLAAETGGLLVHAGYDADTGEFRVVREAGAAPEGRVIELWAIAGDAAPVSLGLVDGALDEVIVLDLPDDLAAGAGALVLAISEEPPGGSPTGAPTGAVLAAGPLAAL